MQYRLAGYQLFTSALAISVVVAFVATLAGQSAGLATPVNAPTADPVDESEEDKQERLVAERFQELLIKRPRPGTALDKVYEFHLQRGTLDKYCTDLQMYATENSHGESWLLLGLVLLQRGRESEAIAALQKVDELLPQDAMASYYYAKSLALIGNAEQAVEAMNRAIERKPSKSELLLVLQDLGRLYQRMGRAKEATDVWKNLETSFPSDARVKEQIAAILAEEGAIADALARYEELVEATKDRYRKVELSVFAAQLKETLGRRDEALADFERLLGQVNPDSWMHQDLRSRIDRTFTSRNDYDGLAKYYQRWVEANPDDVDAMLRVGRFLSIQKRTPEAKEWFTKAINRVPTNPAPRLALVEVLEREKLVAEAKEALRAVVELEPNNVDHIVHLGRLTFADPTIPENERARSAAEVWKLLLKLRGDDAATVSRVGDLLGSVKLVDEAVAAYRKAIELAEDTPQYREYLGEYLLKLDRKEEALAVWREMASGPRETRDNLARLSEVLASFHLDEEALATMARACSDNPTFDQRITYTKMLRRSKKFDEAVKQIELATSMAESVKEQEVAIEQQVETYQVSGQLQAKITELEAAVASTDQDNSKSWQKLALFLEAERKFDAAKTAIERAVELSPQSTAMLIVQARLLEKSGLVVEGIEALRKLAALDRRLRSNYLMQIATLQSRVGQVKAAVETGKELVAGAANSEQLKFFADLCFRAGEESLGLDTLRRNVRRNPNDRDALRSLANKLALSAQDTEAIELYWRSFAGAVSTEERRNDVLALTSIYSAKDQVQQLLDRLSNLGQERGDLRETTLLMAAAKQAIGDAAGARALLESLVTEDSHDVEVLDLLIQFAVTDRDWESAARYQRQLNASAPSPDGEMRLAKFLVEKGEVDEPLAIWEGQSRGGDGSERIVQIMDLLFKNRQREKAIEYARKAIENEPANWELCASVMGCMWRNRESERAMEAAQHLLKFELPFDTPTAQYQKRLANASSTVSTPGPAPKQANLSSRIELLDRFEANVSLLFSISQSPSHIISFGDAKLVATLINEFGASFTRDANGVVQVNSSKVRRKDGKPIDVSSVESIEEIWEMIAAQHCARRFLGYSAAATAEVVPLDTLLVRLIELGDREAAILLLESRFLGRLARKDSLTRTLRSPRPLSSWLYISSNIPSPALVFNANGRGQAQSVPRSIEELDRLSDLYEQTVAMTKTNQEQIAYLLWFAEEYRLANRDIRVATFVTKAQKLVEDNAPIERFMEFLPFDRQYALKKFTECFSQPSRTPFGRTNTLNANIPAATPYAAYAVSMFLSDVITTSNDDSEFASLCTAIKEVQVASARKLTPSQLAAYTPNAGMHLAIYDATASRVNTSDVRFSVMAESAFQSIDLVTALYFIHLRAKPEAKQAVADLLTEDAEAPDDDPLKSAVDRISYATWLWWDGKKEDALKQMDEFRKLGIGTDIGAIIESRMLVEMNKNEDAIELLDSITSTNPGLIEYRELTLMSLGFRSGQNDRGQNDRARKAVERLYAMPLDNATQMQVSKVMDDLGMTEMSDAIVQRVRRSGPSDLPTMMQLMLKLKGSDVAADKAAALELAWKIYQRTTPRTQTMTSGISASATGRAGDFRTETVRVLVESGETDQLIKSLEERLARTPKNAALAHQLAELYRETGKTELTAELLKPFLPSGGGSRIVTPVIFTTEEQIAQDARARVLLLENVIANGGAGGIERLKSELFHSTRDKRQLSVNAQVTSILLGTDSMDRRNSKGKLHTWLGRVAASAEGKEKLKQFVAQLETTGTIEITLPQWVSLVCYADATEDKENALRIAKSIVSHRDASFSAAALSTAGRETTWAVVPIALKLGDADLAVKLAQIALKPASDISAEALQLRLDLALLQIELGKHSDAEQSFQEIMVRLNAPHDKELQVRSELAMRIAMIAADRSLIDVSCEAVLRGSYLASTGSQKMNEDLLKLIQTWQSKQASPERVYNTIKEVIFRKSDPNRWRIYPEPRRNFGGSHDFTFPESEPKPLALVLVDLAKASDTLPSLMQDLDTFAAKPEFRNVMNAIKAYAQRSLGNTTDAAKQVEEVIAAPKTIPDEMLLLYAFTTPVPGGDAATVIPKEVIGPLLKKFMAGRIMHTGTRIAVLSQIKACIAVDDQVMLDHFVAAVADAISKVENYEEESLRLMQVQFYRYVAGECKTQGKVELAEKYLKLAEAQ